MQLENEWKVRFEEYKKSGLSVNAWCKETGFKATTFHYWIKRFNTSEEDPSAKTQFAEVMLQSNNTNDKVGSAARGKKEAFYKTDTTQHIQTQSSEFQVFINNIRVIVPGDFSPAALAGLMKVLKTL